jgi:hypothetical protein
VNLLTQWRIQSSAGHEGFWACRRLYWSHPRHHLRRKLDHLGSFEATGAFDPEQPPEESTANLGLVETSNADFGPDIIVPIQFYETYQHLTQSWNKSLPLGLLPFLSLLLPQEKLLLTCLCRRSGPPWSRPQLRRTVVRRHLSRRPHLLTHLVRQALRFHTVCLVQVLFLHSLLPFHRLWVWGQEAQTLLCKVNLGALMSLSMRFLTLEVISLLRPLRSVVRISSPPGSLHTQVHLEPGVKDTCANSAGRFVTVCLERDVW